MRALVLLAATLSFGACVASTTQPSLNPSGARPFGAQQDCFNVSFATSYDVVGPNTVRLNVEPSAAYDLTVAGPQCDRMDSGQLLALESMSSSWICAGHQAGQGNIAFRDLATGRRVSCYVESVARVDAQ
jgi:hypothetical protein